MESHAYNHQGERLDLIDTGKGGGEGRIYRIQNLPFSCAKLYHAEKLTRELHEKILVMVNNPPNDPRVSIDGNYHSIGWPEAVLYRDAGRSQFAGFSMPFVDLGRFKESHKYYDPDDRTKSFGGSFTWRHLMTAAHNLSSTITAIHKRGHCIGDLRETNILVASNALVTLIDCDSFQVQDADSTRMFYTRVGTGEYLPPELMGVDFKNDLDRYRADLFAIGILVFKFLMSGTHPYQARGALVEDTPSTEEKIKKGYFPYAVSAANLRPPIHALPYNVVPPALQHLFYRCFVLGHGDPLKRPSAKEWLEALKVESSRLRRCHANENHWFAGHLDFCPWCALARQKGIDLFPGPKALSQHSGAKHSSVGMGRESNFGGQKLPQRGVVGARRPTAFSQLRSGSGRTPAFSSHVLSLVKAAAFVIVLFVIGAAIGSILFGSSRDRLAARDDFDMEDTRGLPPGYPSDQGYGNSPSTPDDSSYGLTPAMNSSNTIRLTVLSCERFSDGSLGVLVEFQNRSEGDVAMPSNQSGDGAYVVDESGNRYSVAAFQGSRTDKELSLGPQESVRDQLVFPVSGGTRYELNYPDFAPIQNVSSNSYHRRPYGAR